MKLFIALSFILLGCGISKKQEIRTNAATGVTVYSVWVYDGWTPIETFQTPISGITQRKIDSVHCLADSLVNLLKNN